MVITVFFSMNILAGQAAQALPEFGYSVLTHVRCLSLRAKIHQKRRLHRQSPLKSYKKAISTSARDMILAEVSALKTEGQGLHDAVVDVVGLALQADPFRGTANQYHPVC